MSAKASPKMDFRGILRGEFESRVLRNSRYSLRSFARDLKISPSTLSEVLSGRYGLSGNLAQCIAQKLGMEGDDAELFVRLAESEGGRSPVQRKLAAERLKVLGKYKLMGLDAFHAIADWYHFAILEMTYLDSFQSSADWISRRLGLDLHLVESALERLRRLGLVVRLRGVLRASEDFTAVGKDVPSIAVRRFHSQVLSKAQRALEVQSVESRDFSATLMAIDVERISEAKEAIRRFKREFCRDVGKGDRKNAVYCLSVQFFNLLEPEVKSEELKNKGKK